MQGESARNFESKYGHGSIELFYAQSCKLMRKELSSESLMRLWHIKSRKVLWSNIHALFDTKLVPKSETIETLQNIIDIGESNLEDSRRIVAKFTVARERVLKFDTATHIRKI